jgi:cell division protein FtsL
VRLNLILTAMLVFCALSLVNSQYKARLLVVQFEQEQSRKKQLNVEYGQLQIEQETWAMHSRVERIATERLHMLPQDPRRTVLMPFPQPEKLPAGGAAQPGHQGD